MWSMRNEMSEEDHRKDRIMRQLKEDFKRGSGAILGIALFYYILSKIQYSTCPFLMLTGIPCPFCGMTRAAFGLLRGDFLFAWQANPMIYGLLVLGMAFVIVRSGKKNDSNMEEISENQSVSEKFRKKRATICKKIVGLFFILLILVYLIRMITMFPDQWPMLYYQGNDLQRVIRFFC